MQFKLCTLLVLATLSGVALADDYGASSHLKLSESGAPDYKHWSIEWRGKMGGESVSEGKDVGVAASFSFGLRVDRQFAPWMRVHLAPNLQLYSSRLQERYDNDNYQNRLHLDSGFIAFQPTSFLEARVGAFDQREFLNLPILISQYRTFPGLQEIAFGNWSDVEIKLVAQQLVPTSNSLNTEREDKEALPSFQTQSLHLKKYFGGSSLSGMVGHYSWSRLPDKVAYQSALAGNTVDNGEAAPGARLAYEFDGYFWGLEYCLCGDGPLKWDLAISGEHNSKAPGPAADAQMWSIGPKWTMGAGEIGLRYYNYFVESDATVGLYTRSSLGYANRVGDVLELTFAPQDLGFKVVGQYTNARTLIDRSSDNQQTLTQIWLGVETEYAPF